MRRCQKK